MKLINLLPKSRQQELYFEQLFHKLTFVLWLTAFSFLLVLGAQLAVKIYLESQSRDIASQISLLKSQVNKSDNEQIKKSIKSINDYISDFKNLSVTPKWSKVLNAFAKLPPDSVGVTSFNVDLKTKSVNIQGFAPRREDVIQLYNNIASDNKEFYNIDYPLENVAKPLDNQFHFNFNIRDDLLK